MMSIWQVSYTLKLSCNRLFEILPVYVCMSSYLTFANRALCRLFSDYYKQSCYTNRKQLIHTERGRFTEPPQRLTRGQPALCHPYRSVWDLGLIQTLDTVCVYLACSPVIGFAPHHKDVEL